MEIEPVRDEHAVIPGQYLYPRSMDERFATLGGTLIYAARELDLPAADALTFDNKDRLLDWFGQDHYMEIEQRVMAEQGGQTQTAFYHQALLQKLYQSPNLHLQAIRTGINPGNAFPWIGFAMTPRPMPMLFSTE